MNREMPENELEISPRLLEILTSLPRQPEGDLIDHGVSAAGMVTINASGGMQGIEIEDPEIGIVKYIPASISGNKISWVVWVIQEAANQTLQYTLLEDGNVLSAVRVIRNDPESFMNPEDISDLSLLEAALMKLDSLPNFKKAIVPFRVLESTGTALVDIQKIPPTFLAQLERVMGRKIFGE